MGGYAYGIREKIMNFYYKTGDIEETHKFCIALLESKRCKEDKIFLAQVHGEVCECVLECNVIDFIRKHNLKGKWFYQKGMILKDPYSTYDNGYLTELDMTIFTPFKVLTIECKCYGGDKKLINECTIVRKGKKKFDVYNQHRKHYKVLMDNLDRYRLKEEYVYKYAPLQIGFFNFSLGDIKDCREKEWKMKMPLLTQKNIQKLLKTYLDKPVCWDMPRVKKAIDIICKNKSEKRKEHLSYVKSIHK